MKLKNTPNRKKFVPFAGAFIEVPVKAQWLAINKHGMVFATENLVSVDVMGFIRNEHFEPVELIAGSMLVAQVENHEEAQVIAIVSLMAGAA